MWRHHLGILHTGHWVNGSAIFCRSCAPPLLMASQATVHPSHAHKVLAREAAGCSGTGGSAASCSHPRALGRKLGPADLVALILGKMGQVSLRFSPPMPEWACAHTEHGMMGSRQSCLALRLRTIGMHVLWRQKFFFFFFNAYSTWYS